MNNIKKSLVPHRRFKEFQNAGAWEQRKLQDIADYIRGSFPQPYGEPSWYGGENAKPFVQVVDVNDNLKLFKKTKQLISKKAQPKSRFVPKGSLIVTLQGSIGRVAITQYDSYCDRTLLIFQKYKFPIDTYFFAFSLQILFDVEKSKAPGGTIKTITKKALSSFTTSLPSVYEQQKIGKFMKLVNQTIALHQRKIDKLKKLKSAYLMEMFPAEGEHKPKRRFAGFTDDWEQRKLGDVVAKLSKKEKSSSGLPAVEYDDVIARDGILNKNIENKPHGKIGTYFDRETVLFGKLRPYLKNWLNPQFNGVAVGDWWVLKPNDLLNVNFLYWLIQTKHFMNIANQTTGTKMPRSDWNLVSNTKFFIPRSLQEQNKIAENLANLQNIIILHQRKIDKLKKLKDAYLNEMFV